MKELLIAIASGLVEYPDQIVVEEAEPNDEGVIVYTLTVAEEDKGRVIGKQGRIAKSIRSIMRSVGIRKGQKVTVEIA